MSLEVSPNQAETQRRAPDALTPNAETPNAETNVVSPQRRQMLTLGIAGAAALGVATLAASPTQADTLRGLKGFLYLDPLVVNFAFEMEEMESEFFRRAVVSSGYEMLNEREKSVFNLIANEDLEHFEAIGKLRARNNNKSAGSLETPNASSSRRPGLFTFGGSFNSRDRLFSTALDIKETVLFAYHGAVDIVAKDTLMLAAAIAGVEGRHVAVLRELNGLDPVPEPFEKRLYPDAVGKRLKKYGFNGGGYGLRGGTR